LRLLAGNKLTSKFPAYPLAPDEKRGVQIGSLRSTYEYCKSSGKRC